MEENINEVKVVDNTKANNPSVLAGAIVLAGVIIAGAILLKGSSPAAVAPIPVKDTGTVLAPVSASDRVLGNPQAKVTLVLYEDFQCPFCGAISGLQSNTEAIKYLEKAVPGWTPFIPVVNDYIKNGQVFFTYRDFAFLGPESMRSAEAARCAGDQNKFWEYHDYLYAHQNGENQGGFSDPNLKSFAKDLGLNTVSFNSCMDTNKYTQAVIDSKTEGIKAGVSATPKGFILRNGKIVDTIEGAESATTVKQKIDSALK